MNATITIQLQPKVTTDDDAYGPIVAAYLETLAQNFREGDFSIECVLPIYDEHDTPASEPVGRITVERRPG